MMQLEGYRVLQTTHLVNDCDCADREDNHVTWSIFR
jgi:hypothetical protein